MLHMPGELFVRTFGGRRGRFNIGKLVTAYGEFSVRDVLIDELDEGAYPGTFAVERFVLANSQMPSGAVIVEMRARLAAMHLATERPTSGALEPVGIEERDPIDEVVDSAPAPAPEPAAAVAPEPSAEPSTADLAGDDAAAATDDRTCDEAELFAELWPLGDAVQLDPAIGRPVMRRQIEALKRRGYRYNAQRKVWHLSSVGS